MYAVFVKQKKKDPNVDPPCMDPVSFGRGKEPSKELLLRRGRVTLFATKEDAAKAVQSTCIEMKGSDFLKNHEFVVLECEQ